MEPLRHWLRRTRRMAAHLRHVHRVVDKLEKSYEDMRDKYPQDDNKEAIGDAFSKVMDAKMAFCSLPPTNGSSTNMNIAAMSGGARRRRRATRRRNHH